MSQGALPLEVTDVHKYFGAHHVLDGVSLKVKEQQIFGIVGLNGIGKTTLLKIVLGLLSGDSGEVKIFGKDYKDPSSREKLSYLPEKFQPPQVLTGHEFLQMACAQYKTAYSKDKAEQISADLDLDPKRLSHKIATYSKGMGQKVGLISQLLRKPPLLVLDEPMSGLDPKARVVFKKVLLDYKKHGTVLFSSHILADIEEISDEMAVLHASKILYDGKPSQFKTKHKGSNLENAFLKATENAA